MLAMIRTVWRVARAVGLGLVLILAPAGARAAAAEEPASGEESREHHANVLALFLGHTAEEVDGGDTTESGFTFGVEYTRRITPRVSLGGLVERAGGDIRSNLLLAQAYYRIAGGFRVLGGPGVEFRDGESEEHEEAPVRERDTTVFVLRVGALYEFEIGRWVVAPTAAIDFVGRDEALVLGVEVGYAF
jgi:hypothetical protein